MLSPSHDELISVVMPVHNGLPYLDEAIRSILAQSYSNFEFVILDDGSTDGSTERLREWQQRSEWPQIGSRAAESMRELVPAQPSSALADELLRIAAELALANRSSPGDQSLDGSPSTPANTGSGAPRGAANGT